MQQAIVRTPIHVSRSVLKVIGAVVTFILTFYCYATGQVGRTAPSSQGADQQSPSFLAALLGAVPALQGVTPDYGVTPLYGIEPLYGVVEYGVPYADFLVKGTIRQEANTQPIAGIQVVLEDTATKAVLISDTTDAQGVFSLALSNRQPWANTWILRAEDVDGILNSGTFTAKDTTITIPQDSLKGGGTPAWYAGKGETSVELSLQKVATNVSVPAIGTLGASPSLIFSRISASQAEIRFSLQHEGRARLRVYDAAGTLAAHLFDGDLSPGTHALPVDVSRLPAGACFFRLDSGGISRVIKVMIAR